MVSKNADGTGDILVGDTIEFTTTDPNLASSRFTYNTHEGCTKNNPPLQPMNITHLFREGNNHNLMVRFLDWCGWSKNVSTIYVVNKNIKPVEVTPFLDLPWDYEAQGLRFTEAALSISAYFDHEYPLLSSGMLETPDISDTIISFQSSRREKREYSSHDGYDYAKSAKANDGDPVLSAASGWATYKNTCSACGNMITINHQNRFETRYLHLHDEGLIATEEGKRVWVNARQTIGKIGATGRADGAHIHFGVFYDKDNDGDFTDNVPDGVTDPFGWQSQDPDPWEIYAFTQNDIQKTGMKSQYLWKKPLNKLAVTLTSKGGEYGINRYKLKLPQGLVTHDMILTLDPSPIFAGSASLMALGP